MKAEDDSFIFEAQRRNKRRTKQSGWTSVLCHGDAAATLKTLSLLIQLRTDNRLPHNQTYSRSSENRQSPDQLLNWKKEEIRGSGVVDFSTQTGAWTKIKKINCVNVHSRAVFEDNVGFFRLTTQSEDFRSWQNICWQQPSSDINKPKRSFTPCKENGQQSLYILINTTF